MTLLPLIPTLLVEKVANNLLHRDPESVERLQRLDGKRLRFHLKELPFEITVSVDTHGVQLSTSDESDVDCRIATEMGVLPELQDTANLTRLIKADLLDIDGDPMLAQQVVSLFKSLNVDWEAELAKTIGDVAAHWLGKLWRRSREQVKTQWQQQQRWVHGVLTEEKKLLPVRAEFDQFKTDLQQLRAQIERLERQCREKKG
ncbi:ubiquinone biosynthesis accessory factor UbiJ [Idiomarina abyssalis]|uniref:ubiquinone biosynthesis accessory factor UbiJ n=1 Tax=Idiomarina abyssalis TaxID=86102 RepID=UPI001CD5E7CB|nr:SCP2 sterol-binding domain-containing protein [Idiomarina abyssalis]